MITKNDIVKLMDYGIAKLIVDATVQTVVGTVVDTYAYMSLEQIESKEVDHKADIYSLGVVCYEMLAGGLLYSVTTTASLAVEISSGRYKTLKNRFNSAQDFAEMLKMSANLGKVENFDNKKNNKVVSITYCYTVSYEIYTT